jgi:hypothetical protein
MRRAVGRVDPDEGGDLEFGCHVVSRVMSHGATVQVRGRFPVIRQERHRGGDLQRARLLDHLLQEPVRHGRRSWEYLSCSCGRGIQELQYIVLPP